MNNNTVWLVRESRNDLSQVEKDFGKINTIFQNGISPLDMASQDIVIKQTVLPVFTEDDLILLDGPTVMVSMLLVKLTSVASRLRVLSYNPKAGRFIERVLVVDSD